jgi:F-type H+-transporting ATPase subunit b
MATGARWAEGAIVVLCGSLFVARAAAQGQPSHEPPEHALPQRPPGAPPDHGLPRGLPRDLARGLEDRLHGPAERAGHADPHGAKADPHGAHSGGHAEHDENAPPPPINWWHGIVGEKADTPPSLLWREPGEPPPFLASLLNFGVLVFIVVRFGKKPLANALVKRKETIVRELEDARRLREAAQKRLAEYESKLEKIHEDLERVRLEFREQGELEKQRIVRDAKERRERMRKDAEVLLSQEAKQIRQDLLVEVVREATRVAKDLLAKEMTLGDHDKFAENFLNDLRAGTKQRGSGTTSASAAAKGGAS